jgi:Rrf2 family iron-sulfur cluster assembly transcriptional regulator
VVFTKGFSYSIKVLIYLAIHRSEDRSIGSREISQKLEIPVAFVSKILRNLVEAGMILSHKGPQGGFRFLDSTLDIPLADVIQITDQRDYFTKICVLHFGTCNARKPCPLHHLLVPVNEELKIFFEKTKFRQLLEENNQETLERISRIAE